MYVIYGCKIQSKTSNLGKQPKNETKILTMQLCMQRPRFAMMHQSKHEFALWNVSFAFREQIFIHIQEDTGNISKSKIYT